MKIEEDVIRTYLIRNVFLKFGENVYKSNEFVETSNVENKTSSNLTTTIRDVLEWNREPGVPNLRLEKLRDLYFHQQKLKDEKTHHISSKIHDELGGTLNALSMNLYWLNKRLAPSQKELLEISTSMTELLDSTIQTFQKIYSEIKPAFLPELGFSDSIHCVLENYNKRAKINFKADLPETLQLSQYISSSIFHICRELIKNVVEHSKATSAEIELTTKNEVLVFIVKDNGVGFDKNKVIDSESYGFIEICEIVHFLNGTITVQSQNDFGTEITVTIPFKNH